MSAEAVGLFGRRRPKPRERDPKLESDPKILRATQQNLRALEIEQRINRLRDQQTVITIRTQTGKLRRERSQQT